jgi:hypothetical protein
MMNSKIACPPLRQTEVPGALHRHQERHSIELSPSHRRNISVASQFFLHRIVEKTSLFDEKKCGFSDGNTGGNDGGGGGDDGGGGLSEG